MNFVEFIDYYDPLYVLQNCFFSLSRVVVGVFLATLVGIGLGLFRSSLPAKLKKNRILTFLFEAPKFPPPIAWIPFVILFFGIGETSAYLIVFIGAFSPVFTSAFEGAESVPEAMKNTARSLEIKGIHFYTKIVFMATLPQIFTGLRVAVSMGWMSVIAAEMISGQSGLGYSIQLNSLNLQYDLMTIDMVLIGSIGFALYTLTTWSEKRLMPWHQRSRSQPAGAQ